MATENYLAGEEPIKVPKFEEGSGFYTDPVRSKLMGRIRSKNTKAEMLLRRTLWARNIRFRVHAKGMPGKPDIVINKYRLVIFVDGGFWHGFQWQQNRSRMKTNSRFWIPKIERNMQRDRDNTRQLEEAGYTVMRFWDHEVLKDLYKCVNQVALYIDSARTGVIPGLF